MERITRNYKVAANGLLSIKNRNIYISVEDGPQDVNLVDLLEDFSDKTVRLSCAYDEDIEEPELDVNEETGEVI